MARGRNAFSMVVNCLLNIGKMERTHKWGGHASQVRFILKLCLPLPVVVTRQCFLAGHINFKGELYKEMLPISLNCSKVKKKRKRKLKPEHWESCHNGEVTG